MKKQRKLSEKEIEELTNFIRLTADTSETRRSQAVILLNQEMAIENITTLTCLKRRQIFQYRSNYLKEGIKGLENKRKGKIKTLLTRLQREEILGYLNTTMPKDHEYESDYWSTGILGNLIKEKYGVVYKTKKPCYLLFKEAKFSFHKPGQVYEKRDEAKVKAWKEELSPRIENDFKDSNTIILCEDEMVLSSTTTFQKIWLKKGEYPKIEVSNTKKNKSIYGFLNIKTGKQHAFIKDWQNMYITVDVLKEIRKIYPKQKLVIFWDGAGWHRGSKVQDFIKEDGLIETIYFPPYSPEENPQEHVWKAGRSAVTHNQFIQSIDQSSIDFVTYINQETFYYKLIGYGADA